MRKNENIEKEMRAKRANFENLDIFDVFSNEKRGYPYNFSTFRNLMGGIPPGSSPWGGDHSPNSSMTNRACQARFVIEEFGEWSPPPMGLSQEGLQLATQLCFCKLSSIQRIYNFLLESIFHESRLQGIRYLQSGNHKFQLYEFEVPIHKKCWNR